MKDNPCASSPCIPLPCGPSIAERPRYFPRQLITPDDLTLEQDYFRNKLRRHNRMLHGWGVVCGAKVCPVASSDTATGDTGSAASSYQPWVVSVSKGYILGPYGDEIIIDCCRTVDLRTAGTSGVTGEPCVEAPDPWCTDVFVKRDPTAPLYVAVKYRECRTRPVRVQPIGCGCDDTQCEYSRVRDGYEIGILTQCPDSQMNPPKLDDLGKGSTPDCPDCPSSPWVVLAKVVVDEDGTIASIDNCSCRRIVLSFGDFWWACQAADLSISGVTAVDPTVNLQAVPQGSKNLAINVALKTQVALPAAPQTKADLGSGVVVNSFVPGAPGQTAMLNIDVAPTAVAGPRTLTVMTTAGFEASMENAIRVVAPAGTGAVTPTPSPAPTPSPVPQPSGGTPPSQPAGGGASPQPAAGVATHVDAISGEAVTSQPEAPAKPARKRGRNP